MQEPPTEAEGPTRRRRSLLVGALVVLVVLAASAALALREAGRSTVVADRPDRRTTSTTTAVRRSSTTTTTTTTTSTTVAPTTALPTTAPTTTAPPPPVSTTTTTTACLGPWGGVPHWGNLTSRYDPATVQDPGDPRPATCPWVRRVLVLGDSTGRGTANGLRRLLAGDLEIWDRTFLGCGMVADTGQCPNWRARWTSAMDEVRPDVVLVYTGVSSDLRPGGDPPFLSAEGTQIRRAELAAAMDLLRSRGAAVVWAIPAVPLDRGLFYCGGRRSETPCDPAWISRWRVDVTEAAAPRRVAIADVERFVAGRPGLTAHDRPDGLHMSGPALDAQAAWLADQLRSVQR